MEALEVPFLPAGIIYTEELSMIGKRIATWVLAAAIFVVSLGMPGMVKADPVAEARQLQEAGDITGAYDLLKKASTDLGSKLKKN
jgi:hypothetical protein